MKQNVQQSRNLVVLDGDVQACIETKGGSTAAGNSFILSDCLKYDKGIDVMHLHDYSYAVMIRLRADPEQCMQATHSGVLEHGAWLRVYPCDPNNPLQRFNAIGTLQLENTEWCVAYWGMTANHDENHIMLKKCETVDYGWSHD